MNPPGQTSGCKHRETSVFLLLAPDSLLQSNRLIAPGQRRLEPERETINWKQSEIVLATFPAQSFRRVRKFGMPHINILVVDDFLPWHEFVVEMFESEDADSNIFSFAVDGWEAVQKAQELQPDLILMDISLPVMDGFEAARKIRALSPRSKILFVSERRSREYIQAALDAGASGYILKSDANSDLFQGIAAALGDQQFISRSLKDWRKSSDSGE